MNPVVVVACSGAVAVAGLLVAGRLLTPAPAGRHRAKRRPHRHRA